MANAVTSQTIQDGLKMAIIIPVRLLWDATTDAFIMNLLAGMSDTLGRMLSLVI